MAVHRDLTHVEQVDAAAEEIATVVRTYNLDSDTRERLNAALLVIERVLDANLPYDYEGQAMHRLQQIIREAHR